jgi:hypothetical protein
LGYNFHAAGEVEEFDTHQSGIFVLGNGNRIHRTIIIPLELAHRVLDVHDTTNIRRDIARHLRGRKPALSDRDDYKRIITENLTTSESLIHALGVNFLTAYQKELRIGQGDIDTYEASFIGPKYRDLHQFDLKLDTQKPRELVDNVFFRR